MGSRIAWVGFATLVLFGVLSLTPMVDRQAKADEYNCGTCHGSKHHGDTPPGCSFCHDAPPQTASHLAHFNSTPLDRLAYGDTAIIPDSTKYMFGCGNCHPMDPAKHRDGILQVELYDAAAPENSIKSLHPDTATYTPGPNGINYAHKLAGRPDFSYSDGTCSNVYCHSYNEWTTPLPQYATLLECESNNFAWSDGACYGVPAPWTPDQTDWPVPANTVTTRHYRNQTWGGNSLDCSGCHANSPSTAYPKNAGGAGDSHGWVDQNGLNNLHMNNMTLWWYHEPIGCRICHNDTIADPSPVITEWISTYFEANTYPSGWYDYPFPTFDDVAIDDFTKHVNGTVDVAFDKINSVVYESSWYDTAAHIQTDATYDPETKTCTNVSCHKQETAVTWGTPYRYSVPAECNRCHQQDPFYSGQELQCDICHEK